MSHSFFEVLTAILPVIGMIFIGVFLKKTQWISRKGIDDIKFLVSRIMLTVAVSTLLQQRITPVKQQFWS